MNFLRTILMSIFAIFLVSSGGVASAAKIQSTCVQINGKVVLKSQWTGKVMGAVDANLGKAMMIYPNDPALIGMYKGDGDKATVVVTPINGELKFTKMFRIFINGEFVRDTMKVLVAKQIIEENIVKGNVIKIRLRTAEETKQVKDAYNAAKVAPKEKRARQDVPYFTDEDIYRALGINHIEQTLAHKLGFEPANKPAGHQILGVASSASPNEMRKAYYKLMLRWHPDRNPHDPFAEAVSKVITDAYDRYAQ